MIESQPIEMITKFEQFSDYLENSIRKGEFKTGQKIPSERDFAKKFGMSHMTVNKAMSGLVARNMLRRIHGDGTYVAETQKTLISQTVLSIIETSQESHAQFISVLPGLLVQKDYMPAIYEMGSAMKVKDAIRKLFQDVPRALIVDGTGVIPYDILDELSPETHLVFINRFEGKRKYNASYVLSDYVAGGYMAVQHLLKLGCRRIMAMTLHFKPGWTSELFINGCRRALAEAGLLESATFMHGNIPDGKKLGEIFSARTRPDGIVSLSDFLLGQTGKFLQKSGIRSPEDVAMIGYFSTPWADAFDLTSLSIRADFISEKAVEAIETGNKINMKVKPEFVFRKSCPEK